MQKSKMEGCFCCRFGVYFALEKSKICKKVKYEDIQRLVPKALGFSQA